MILSITVLVHGRIGCILCKRTFLNLAYFGGHARHILPTLSPSQPVITDEEIICWGTLLNFFAFFAFCDIPFLVFSPFLLTFVSFRKEPFHFLFILFSALEEESSSPILFCAGRFFARPTYEYIRGCGHRASSDIYDHHRTTSTAQECSIAQSTRATSSKASTLRSERDNAGKQTELARASMSSSVYIQLPVCSKRTKKSKSARPTKILLV